MNITDLLSLMSEYWISRDEPATPESIGRLKEGCKFPLPGEYLDLLRQVNGGKGFLAFSPGYFQLWTAEELLGMNTAYETAKWHPSYFGFGSSLGGVMFAFRDFESPEGRVFGIPFDSIDPEDITIIAENFSAFVRALGLPGDGA